MTLDNQHVYMHTNKLIVIWFMELPDYLSGRVNSTLQNALLDKKPLLDFEKSDKHTLFFA